MISGIHLMYTYEKKDEIIFKWIFGTFFDQIEKTDPNSCSINGTLWHQMKSTDLRESFWSIYYPL
jgi:hypothetical protein